MFTGLVQDVGIVCSFEKKNAGARAEIETHLDLENIETGASICCAGVCLTVVKKEGARFWVDVSAETLSKTSLGRWYAEKRINLEPSLRLGDELGGHFVFGHVDSVATVESKERDGESWRLRIAPPGALMKFIAPKGSVTLDGVSLTVNKVDGSAFEVNIIPHTAEKTTLGDLKPGDAVNIEVDMLARYVARMLEQAA